MKKQESGVIALELFQILETLVLIGILIELTADFHLRRMVNCEKMDGYIMKMD